VLENNENVQINKDKYKNYKEEYKDAVLTAIEKERKSHG
jgi:hypothetical protein